MTSAVSHRSFCRSICDLDSVKNRNRFGIAVPAGRFPFGRLLIGCNSGKPSSTKNTSIDMMHRRGTAAGSSAPTTTAATLGITPGSHEEQHGGVHVPSAPLTETGKSRPGRRRRKTSSSSSSSSRVTLFLTICTLMAVLVVVVLLLVQAFRSWVLRSQPQPRGPPLAAVITHDHPIQPKSPTSPRRKEQERGKNQPKEGEEEEGEMELDDDHDWLPWNSIYRIPDAYPTVGDRSDNYARLRQSFDALLPKDYDRSLQRANALVTSSFQPREMDVHNSDQAPYDIYHCPDTPPVGYPFSWNILRILKNWPPDDPTPRPQVFQGLCIFDYQKDYEKALAYRQAELPFIVVNDPEVARTVERWNHPGYMEKLMGTVKHRCEYSENNHFMYYVPPPHRPRRHGLRPNQKEEAPEGWQPPTRNLRMTYADWLQKANVSDDQLGPDRPHWYFRLIGCGYMGADGSCDLGSSEYLYDELTFFQPKSSSLYMVEPGEQKGIHCRFGMKGVIAENHFDGSRNAIVVLKGRRRYILAHPQECPNLALYPKGHPSARHSAVDWSDPDLQQFPQFAEAKANEVVMQPGYVMYLPTNWFHYIISLDINYQCNARSGLNHEYDEPLRQCGF